MQDLYDASTTTDDNYAAASDWELTVSVANGCHRAFEELYRRHYPMAVACGQRLTRCRSAAEDLAAEAFTRAWQRLAAGHLPDTFAAYLRVCVRNAFADAWRRRGQVIEIEATVLERVPGERAGESVGSVLERLDVERALARLPRRQRDVLRMQLLEDLPQTEIARRMGISAAAVATLARRGRAALVMELCA